MNISVIVTTRNRPCETAAFLMSLKKQKNASFSLVLGLQDSDDDFSTLVQSMPYPIIVQHIPLCSLSEARNILVKNITGDIIAFADDDCLYPPELLELVMNFMQTHPKCGALICDSSFKQKNRAAQKQNRWQVFKQAPSISLFFRREALLNAGDFDTEMGIGASTPWQSGEETDMLLRILDKNYEVWRIPALRPIHPDILLLSHINSEKINAYGMGRMYLLKKHHFPLWFALLNALYPLIATPLDFFHMSKRIVLFRYHMLKGRMQGLISCFWQKK